MKIINAEDAFYSVSYSSDGGNVSGQLSIFTASNKISHLINQPLKFGATTIQYIPNGDVLFIGYADGCIEFRNKEGFTRKGEGYRNRPKMAIKDIKSAGNWVIAIDEAGGISMWEVLDENTANSIKEQSMSQKQQFKSGGGMMMGGGMMGGGGGGMGYQ